MAKKKGKPKASRPRAMVVGLRGSAEWKAWLDEFAEFCRLTKVTLIDQALVDYAQKRGFRPPPKR